MKKAFLIGVFVFMTSVSFADETMPKILWIGDSHTAMTFGKTADNLLRSRYGTENVMTVGSCGATPLYYKKGTATHCGYLQLTPVKNPTTQQFEVKTISAIDHSTPLLENLITESNPNVLIVAHGSNMIIETDDATRNLQIDFILNTLEQHPMKCIWVSHPNMNGLKGRPMTATQIAHVRDQILLRTKEKCAFIDSTLITHYPLNEGDGVHYPPAYAKPWAEDVFRQIQTILN